MITYNDVYTESLKYFNQDELAANVFVSKYALKNKDEYLETTPDDMFRRISTEFARIEFQKFDRTNIKPLTYDEIYNLLKDFKYIIPQGSPLFGIGNYHQYISLSNCFVLESPDDSYGGILKTDQELVQISKRRGGIGLDISKLRPEGMPTSNASRTSTGIIPFMQRYSNSINEVGQNGRRGALMMTIDCHHPQVEDFIESKVDLKKITGANISVKLSNEFLNAVKNKEKYELRFPIDYKERGIEPLVSKLVDANEVWTKIIKNAHASAEPGILFWDNIINNSPADSYASLGFSTVSTNPCIVGETLIAVADGRNAVTIKQLVDENATVPVYSTSMDGQIQIKMARNFRKTGNKKEVWKLTLDDDSTLIATPDHKIFTKYNEYIELKKLKPNMSLSPFNTFESNNGYRQVSNVGSKMIGGMHRNRRQYRLIHEFYSGEIIDSKIFAIHHKDHFKYNDSYSNLEVITHEEHMEYHNIRGDKNPIMIMKKRGTFEDYKKRNSFYNVDGKQNPRYIDISNDELIKEGKKLLERDGKLGRNAWIKYAKENGLPQILNSTCRFGGFNNFKSIVIGNHKVKSVEFYGYEDVYDCTVDDNSNYCIITSYSDDKYIKSSGICVHNCGEIPLSPYDSCRLMVLNLFSYVDNPFSKTPFFNYPLFSKHVQYAQRLMDDLIDLEIEHIDRIIEKIDKDPESDEIKLTEKDLWVKIRKAARLGRRTGLGLTALGDTLAALNVGYATDGSLIDVDNIYKSLMIHSYRASVEMAKEIGPFPIWNSSLEKDNEFILRIKDCDEQLYNDMKLYGRRNISCNTSAPVGSVSLISQTTSGIEPLFMMSYKRRKKLNSTESDIVPDFIDQNDIRWKEFDVYHPKLKLWMDITGETDIAKSPWYGFCADDINWKKRVELQATAQKYIDHSISSTLNLPESATIDDIKMIYETAWESGCKGVTVYRKNSRSGVLIDTTTKKDTNDIVKTTAPKRPKSINAEVYHFKILKENYNVVVGLLNKEPYEIFVSKYDVYSDNTCIPKEVKDGKIVKMKRGHYELITENKNYIISGETLDETVESLTRMISISLRHGVDISFIVQQLEKTKGDLYSFSKALSRALKKYIKDGVKVSGDNCPECNSNNLIREDGCIKCSNCAYSRC